MSGLLHCRRLLAAAPGSLFRTTDFCSCKQWKINKKHLIPAQMNHSILPLQRMLSTDRYILSHPISSQCDLNLVTPSINQSTVRYFSVSNINYESEPLKPSSKVEESIQTLKLKKETEDAVAGTEEKKVVVKKTLKEKIVHELLHYYHGFRLLFIDINISRKLIWRVMNGKTLSRREHKLLIRTTGDVFRLIPFSVFIVVPFMEFLLPVVIKFFPGMLPSTFETSTEKEDKMRQSLKVKLEMAKFLQKTLDEMAPQSKDQQSDLAKEFSDFFVKIRSTGEQPTNDEILRFGKLFEDEITLDSLGRPQLVALCRVLESNTIGTSTMLRFHLRMKLRSLAADDKMIAKEGVNSMTLSELQQACRARGMRAYGMPEERLRAQLQSWLDLSLNEKVPPSLLLLSRALMIPENVPTTDKLKASISILPENVVLAQKAAISEKEGKVDNKAKIEAIKEEERKIQEERNEQKEEAARIIKEEEAARIIKEEEDAKDKAPIVSAQTTPELVDKAPIISAEAETKQPPKEEGISGKDIEIIEDALDTLGKNKKKLLVEKEELAELKEEMAEYQEDVQELKVIAKENVVKIQESKGARRLFNKVNSMILKMDTVLENLEKEKSKKLEGIQEATDSQENVNKEELVHIDELMNTIKKIRNVPDDSKIDQIQHILGRLDDDFDGHLKVDDVLKVIEAIGTENVKLSTKQVGELIELLDKEEILDVENKIQKALQKEIELDKIAQEQIDVDMQLDNTKNVTDNLLKEAEKQEVIKEAIEKNKETILPKLESQEIQPKASTNGVNKKDTTNESTKTL